ncbi:hypothetical protein [Pedobacter aquatilis]|uniref:hypothetical protein n=1 Tax=Pedobacter aquatilis TaxID=351343 RepID=UPI00292FE58F|nr:hypothetical protein [Pedobacter aquatilis]
MPPKLRYHFTGLDNKKYLCQQRPTIVNNGVTIYTFLAEFDGSIFSLKKIDGKWVYHSGLENYNVNWVKELGSQIDSGEFL